MGTSRDEGLDRYSLKERLEGFTLDEVLSLYGIEAVREYVDKRISASTEPPAGVHPDPVTDEFRRLCAEMGTQMECLRQELNRLVGEVREKDCGQANPEQGRGAIRDVLDLLPDGNTTVGVRVESGQEEETWRDRREAEGRLRGELVRVLQEFKGIPAWHPFFRRKSTLVLRKLESILTG